MEIEDLFDFNDDLHDEELSQPGNHHPNMINSLRNSF